MNRPVITLTTDYGTTDHLVGTMKGVILNILPDTQIVDITHSIRAYDVLEAALAVASAYRYFPAKTVHVIVVDPGVGTPRRAILAEAGGQFFIAPDNGVISAVLEKEPDATIRHITAEKYFLKPVSRTFHGRDIFSPCATWLAKTGDPASLGEITSDYICFQTPRPLRAGKSVRGSILRADHFGNLLTNLTAADLPELAGGEKFRIQLGAGEITRRVETFAEGAEGEVVILLGSSGYYEIVVNRGSAARMLGAQRGAEVIVEFGERHGESGD